MGQEYAPYDWSAHAESLALLEDTRDKGGKYRGRRAAIHRRYWQIDNNLVKVISYLAQMWRAIKPQHLDYAFEVFQLIVTIEMVRKQLLGIYRKYDKGPEKGLWTPETLPRILEESAPVPKSIR